MPDRNKTAAEFWVRDLWKASRRSLHLGWVLQCEYVFVRSGRWERAPRADRERDVAWTTQRIDMSCLSNCLVIR